MCWLIGHDLLIDHDVLIGTCLHCERTYHVSYDMSYGYTNIGDEINCGEYWCHVETPYGFVPEAGCPTHD